MSQGFTNNASPPAVVADETTLHLSGTTLSVLNNGVGNAQLAQMAAGTIKGNNISVAANAADLSASAVVGLLRASSAIAAVAVSGSGADLTNGSTPLSKLISPAHQQYYPSNPTAITSLSAKMCGLGSTVTITPTATGKLLVIASGQLLATPTTGVGLFYGTGMAPANGATQTGTAGPGFYTLNMASAGNLVFIAPFSLQAYISGLTLSTAYWFDLALESGNGGNSNVGNVSFTLIELP